MNWKCHHGFIKEITFERKWIKYTPNRIHHILFINKCIYVICMSIYVWVDVCKCVWCGCIYENKKEKGKTRAGVFMCVFVYMIGCGSNYKRDREREGERKCAWVWESE